MGTMKRAYSIDVIKALACFFVSAVHFRNRLQPKIPKELFGFKSQLAMSVVYAVFVIAVPLFLLSTGYLMSNKQPSKKYALGVIKIYSLYLFSAVIGYSLNSYLGVYSRLSIQEIIYKTSDFSLISGWYIEMYVGLALLIPFINILIRNLEIKEFQSLIIILIIIIGIPALINSNPTISTYVKLPNFWSFGYPIVYYLIGAYIKRFVVRDEMSIKVLINSFLFYVLSTVTIILIVMKYADPYTHTSEGYYSSVLVMVSATTFFLLVYRFANWKNRFILLVSKHTLPTYLMALPVDRIIYPLIIDLVGSASGVIKFMPLVSLVSFSLSLALGLIVSFIFELVIRGLVSIFSLPKKYFLW